MPTNTIPGSFVAAVTLLGFAWLPEENPELAREFGVGDQAAYDEAPRNTRAQSRDLHGAISRAASHARR